MVILIPDEIGKRRRQFDSRAVLGVPLASPHDGSEAAFRGDFLGEGSQRRRLQQFQRTVEIGLANPIAAHQH